MDSQVEAYLSLDDPPKSDHLWRYTSWQRAHPTGDSGSIPSDVSIPNLKLRDINGEDVEGVTLDFGQELPIPFDGSPTSDAFMKAITHGKAILMTIPDNWNSDVPLVLEITTGKGIEAAHIHIKTGRHSEVTILTRIEGDCAWLGLLRTAETGVGSTLHDVLVNKIRHGSLLRVDSFKAGRDSTITAGTVSAGSKQTKADIRYMLDSTGANLKVLGSLLAAERMHLDHHIEIRHVAPNTYSRLNWHTACSGRSTSVGTGMLKIDKGAKLADAGQLFHNLLLSEKAKANSIPELEVEENDVVGCGHGTANGPVDESQRFYLMARGLSEKESEDALVAAFLNSTLSQMGSELVHAWLIKTVEDALDGLKQS